MGVGCYVYSFTYIGLNVALVLLPEESDLQPHGRGRSHGHSSRCRGYHGYNRYQ